MNQVLELERAILARAQQLAAQFAEQAQRTRDSIMREAAERLRQREQREEGIARTMGERHYRQKVQAAELRLQSTLDRMRWNLVRRVEDRLAEQMQQFADSDPAGYLDYLQQLIVAGAEHFPGSEIRVRCNADDYHRLQPQWPKVQAALPQHTLILDTVRLDSLGGVLLLSADGKLRVDNTFEGRMGRLRPQLQQVILERLLPVSMESGNLFTG